MWRWNLNKKVQENYTFATVSALPVLHSIGLPALGQFQCIDGRFASGGGVVIAGVAVKITTKATHLVLKPLAHCDAKGVEAIVANLDVLRRVDHNKTF